MHTIHDFCIRFINQITKILNIVLNRIALFFFLFCWITSYCCLFLCWVTSNCYLFSLDYIQQVVFFLFRWVASNYFFFSLDYIQLLFCYFWLDPKVTKRSRLNRPGYSGRRLRCRLRNSLRSNNAGSGRYAFTLRFTPVRLGLSQKAELSLMIADTACFSFPFFHFSFCIPLFVSLYLPVVSFVSPVVSLYLPFASPPRRGRALLCPPAKSPTPFRPST